MHLRESVSHLAGSVSPCFLLLSYLALSPPIIAEGTYASAAEGFVARDALAYDHEADGFGVGGLAIAPDGDLVVYADGELVAHGRDGARTIAAFDPPVYGSFVVVAPDGESVYFGESSQWGIYRVPLSGGPPHAVDRLQFAFDLEFDPEGRGHISVLTNDPSTDIVLLDEDPDAPNRSVVTNIPGVSGPIAFDDGGDLYYGTADLSGDPLRQSLHRFTREQLALARTGDPLDFSEGELLLDGMDGFYQLLWHDGKLYYSDLGFKAGVGNVGGIDAERNFLVSELATFPIDDGLLSPTYLAMRPGDRPFAAGSGGKGGSLFVSYSNYWSVLRVAEIVPELHFIRAEVTSDGLVDLSDAVAILEYLFRGGSAPDDIEAADSNGDGTVDLSDAVYVLGYLFTGGPIIPPPYPERGPAP